MQIKVCRISDRQSTGGPHVKLNVEAENINSCFFLKTDYIHCTKNEVSHYEFLK